MGEYTYGDMMREMQSADAELRENWADARPWGSHGAMVVWLKNGKIYKVQKVGGKFLKQALTKEEVQRKYGLGGGAGV